MRRTVAIILIALFPFIAFAKGFVLKGHIDGLLTGAVSLEYVNEKGEEVTLSAPVANYAFTLEGIAAEPELARLTVTEGWSYNITFFLENTTINLQMVKDAPDKTLITGSASQVVYEKLKPGQMKFFAHARQSKSAQQQYKRGSAELKSADSLWYAQQQQWIQTIRTSMSTGAGDYAALHFIKWLLFKPDNLDSIKAVFMQLNSTVRKGPAAKKFLEEFEHLHRTGIGQPAPEITGKDTSGKALTLAAYKGKVVLLDFWASYCGPCRQENKAMVAVYQKYQPQGFEILSFSMDNDRQQWLQAILADGMLWPQASELRGGASATAGIYDITQLPRNVLIDRTGKIYAKDLHGNELIEAVEGLLK